MIAGRPGSRGEVSAIIVTYNSALWIGRSIESLSETGAEVIVVDNGSTDGTLDLVRERFPEARLLKEENRGFGAGNNAGMRIASGRYFLLLNPDAWLPDGSLYRLVAFADKHLDAAVVGPRLLNPDGSLQRSVRGYPTPWRIATEYFFLRKLAPRSHALNAMFGAGFDHESVLNADYLFGACLLVRREAVDSVGGFDEDFFLMSEEVDWCYRFHEADWTVLFYPGAEAYHVVGASLDPTQLKAVVRGHLQFLRKHHGTRVAERARRVMLWGLRLRALLFRGERGRAYRDAARWLGSGSTGTLLGRPSEGRVA
jgi:N-acetylglucosaminyl-diphospho-decaprenol L-rhamnosyltransferase